MYFGHYLTKISSIKPDEECSLTIIFFRCIFPEDFSQSIIFSDSTISPINERREENMGWLNIADKSDFEMIPKLLFSFTASMSLCCSSLDICLKIDE